MYRAGTAQAATQLIPRGMRRLAAGGTVALVCDAMALAGDTVALVVGAAAWLEVAAAQDTGGPFKGSLAISREEPGQCLDNRGARIPEGMLYEPGPDQCQVGGHLTPDT